MKLAPVAEFVGEGERVDNGRLVESSFGAAVIVIGDPRKALLRYVEPCATQHLRPAEDKDTLTIPRKWR